MRQWTYLKFTRVLKKNGYSEVRCKGGHSIFRNNNGHHISISHNFESIIANRLIKENNLML